MTDAEWVRVALALKLIGVSWWFGVEFYRGWSRDHSRRMFWLHLTACPIAIVMMTAALILVAGRHQG